MKPIKSPGGRHTLEKFASELEDALNELESNGYQTPGPMRIEDHGYVIVGRKLLMAQNPLIGTVVMPPPPRRRPRAREKVEVLQFQSEHTEELLQLVLQITSTSAEDDATVVKQVVEGLSAPSEEMRKIADDCLSMLKHHQRDQHQDSEDAASECPITSALELLHKALKEKIEIQMN